MPPATPRPPSRLRFVRAGAVAAAGAIALSLFAAVPATQAAPADDLGSRFTLAVLPDTQFYSRYSADQFQPRYGKDPYQVQTEWLAANRDALNIPFVTQLGDIVDQSWQEREWVAADDAMKTLDDAKLPYSTAPGNHDVRDSNDDLDDTEYDLSQEPFLRWFGPDRAKNVSTYEDSDPTGLSQYHVFEAEGQQYLVLALSWRVSDATIAWADSVIDAHPTLPVILTTHQVIDIDSDAVSPKETEYGLELWDKLIRSNDQIFLTINGHFHGESHLVKMNDFGHSVTQIVIDYQMAYEGGDGYLGLFEFDLSNNVIAVQTASPWVTWKPQEKLTSYDQPFLEGVNQQFDVPIDFAERFASFDPAFAVGPATQPSLSQKARDILLDGFTGPDPVSTEAPGNSDDYVDVAGTLAHWRFTGNSGVVAEGQSVPDVAGDNDLTRVGIAESGATNAQVDDVTIGGDHAYLSSDDASVCFANADRNNSRYSYFQTASDAPVNNESFDNGYTIESFLKIDKSWTASTNQWMMALIRAGNRNEMPGVPYDRWGNGGPVVLGLSNLKEFQWSVIPNEPGLGDRVNWSGEIQLDTWMHVAIVNDPATRTTTMYVNGAPVLRNASDNVGQSFVPDAPWLMGAGMDHNQPGAGWNGCIGETRIVDHVLDQGEWLTARADLTGLTITDAPEGSLPAATKLTTFSGTGLPGAEVRMSGSIAGTDVIDENGRWSIVLPRALAAGAYEASVVQALGTRESAPLGFDFTIEGAAAPTPGGTTPTIPIDGADGSTALANTGAELPAGAVGGAILLALLGIVVLVLVRRRRASGLSGE
ncbi:LamG-like jellyroll fold domain-containing protein [Herbiconiux ginsengi]|uniref:Concanavalin A-like lectin/glucanases superfamily protein n=1 Tax=Herbiconiux ginsengi TaxID=381665 RepID=A0A1H3TVZ0_9MICO|nr:LamG-like jellyroll fold domain-containing protein [Herbiconiux ginsengi]SDZ54237.1 Concanavalin A-like lectin/glucanases superfamily protein [Herbiconiux ginsengi]